MPAPASAVEGSGAKRPAANGGPVKLLQERGQTFRDGLLNVIELDPEHSLPAIRKETSAAPRRCRIGALRLSPEVRIWPLSRRLVLVESPPCSAVRFRSC